MVNVLARYVERLFTMRNRKRAPFLSVCDKLLNMQKGHFLSDISSVRCLRAEFLLEPPGEKKVC